MSAFGIILLVVLTTPHRQLVTGHQLQKQEVVQQAMDRAQDEGIRRSLQGDNLCFAVRSYIFKREGASAPVLIGTTTCTPAVAWRERRAGHGNAQLVPANY